VSDFFVWQMCEKIRGKKVWEKSEGKRRGLFFILFCQKIFIYFFSLKKKESDGPTLKYSVIHITI
jgi:hypothetical protein